MMRVYLLARVVLLCPEAHGVSLLLGRAWPNISVLATANSLRSCVAPAIGSA
jgi:hypothetical protein